MGVQVQVASIALAAEELNRLRTIVIPSQNQRTTFLPGRKGRKQPRRGPVPRGGV